MKPNLIYFTAGLIALFIVSFCFYLQFQIHGLSVTINEYMDSLDVPKVNKKPNFVFFLTDDQDAVLGSVDVMQSVKRLIAEKGITFDNSFVASPLCCPSRSSILTGQYVHNHKAINNSVNGGCSSPSWQNGPEKLSFVNSLHGSGYKTFFAGKYLNQYGAKESGGLKHVPSGWDWWIGLKGNSRYYNYQLSINGTTEKHGNDTNDYLTNVIERRSLEFLDKAISRDQPFFMMLSTPACHAPFDAEIKYNNKFSNKKSPRTRNFNIKNDETKHWLLRLGEQPLSSDLIDKIDDIYRKRLRTLLSVDDMVEQVIKRLDSKDLLDNTYIMFTSDNGYHLGQFSLPLDKREPYEFDIRVPFFIRGPGINPIVTKHPITNIDIAPTILDLAGIPIPNHYDGVSLLPFLYKNTFKREFVASTSKESCNSPSLSRTVLIEHSGEVNVKEGCEHLGPNLYGCDPDFSCKCSDSRNNTYSCLRVMSHNNNTLYCEWDDDESFKEYYDLIDDSDQLSNIASSMSPQLQNQYSNGLSKMSKCQGSNCNILVT